MADEYRFSFPYGIVLVVYPLLAVGIAMGAGKWWGVAFTCAAALLAFFAAREGLSQENFEKIHEQDPSLNRLTWRINWLLFFALPPAVLAFFGVASLFLPVKG